MKQPIIATLLLIVLSLGCLLDRLDAQEENSRFSLFPSPPPQPLLSPPLGSFDLGGGKDFMVFTDYRPAGYQGKTFVPGYAHREAQVTLHGDARSYLSAGLMDSRVLPRYLLSRRATDPLSFREDPSLPTPLFNEQLRAAQPGIQGRQVSGAVGDLSGGFSALEMGRISHTSLFPSARDRINQMWAERSKSAISPDTSFMLKDLAPLSGVEQQDFHLRYAPSPALNFAAEGNEINAPSGAVRMRDTRLLAGRLSLLRRERSVGRTVSDPLLKSLGREDLIALKGVQSEEFQGAWNLSERFSLSHLRKDVNTPGGSIADQHTDLKAGIVRFTQRERSVDPRVTDPVLKGLGRNELLPLRGVKEKGTSVRVAPSESLQLALETNAVETPHGGVEESLTKFVAGGFTLSRRQTSVAQSVSNDVLKGLGRQDLATAKGITGDETFAQWRFQKFTLSELRRTEEVNLRGGLFFGEGTMVNRLQRHGMVFQLSPSSTVQVTQETLASAPKDAEDDDAVSTQRSHTVELSQKISEATSATVSRQQSTLTQGEHVVRADETATQFRTAYNQFARLMVDWRQRDSSDGRASGGSGLALALNPSSSLSLTGRWQSDFTTGEQHSGQYSFSLSQKLGAQRQVSWLTSVRRTVAPGAIVESENQTFSLTPGRGSLVEYTRTTQVNNKGRLERNQMLLRQPLGNTTHLVLRGLAVENNDDEDVSHGFFLETQQRLMTLQVGQEDLMGVDGRFQPVKFMRVAAKPHPAFALDWGMVDRSDLADEPIALTDWKVESTLWGMKLAAQNVENKPVGKPQESILPRLMNGVNQVSERTYSLTLPPLLGEFRLAGMYTSQENLRTGFGTDSYSFVLSDKPGGTTDVTAKYTLGRQLLTGGAQDYAVYELNYRYRLSPDYFVNFSGRALDHNDPAKRIYNLDFSLGWKW